MGLAPRQRGIELHGDTGSLHLPTWAEADSRLFLQRRGGEYEQQPLLREPFPGIDWACALVDLADAIAHLLATATWRCSVLELDDGQEGGYRWADLAETAARQLGITKLVCPNVGIREAVLLELAETAREEQQGAEGAHENAPLTAARQFANRVDHQARGLGRRVARAPSGVQLHRRHHVHGQAPEPTGLTPNSIP